MGLLRLIFELFQDGGLFLPANGICQIHQGNWLTGFGLLFQLCYGWLLTIVDDTVNHAVIILGGHLRCLQVVLFLEVRQFLETHTVAVVVEGE